MKINGVELPDLDVCELSVMEAYEAAHDVVAQKANKATKVCSRRSELIRYQCETIFDFFDTVFGEGTAKKVFGDSCNLKICLDAYEEVCVAVNKLDADFGNRYKNMANRYGNSKKSGKKKKNYNHYKSKLTVKQS